MEKTAEQEWKERAMTFFDKDGIFDYLAGISDFKAALKEDLERQIPDYIGDNEPHANFTLNKLRDLIDQVKPKS